jgi:arginine/lysine/ornithine decarboxylase
MGLADLCQHLHGMYAKYDIARLTTDMYLSDHTPAMKPSDAYAHIAHRKTQRVPIDELALLRFPPANTGVLTRLTQGGS